MVYGSIALPAYVLAYALVCRLLPEESLAAVLAADLGFVILEVGVLLLAVLAMTQTKEHRGRVIWGLVIAWLLLNILGDGSWAVYDIGQGEVPAQGIPDIGYLLSYGVGFAAVLAATWKSAGRLQTIETLLDAMMFSIGAAALSWPALVGPLLRYADPSAKFWTDLAYPIGGFLILFGFVSFFLSAADTGKRPRPYYVLLCAGFAMQMVADSAYLMLDIAGGAYEPGNWIDPVWLLAYAAAGIAALLEMRLAGAGRSADESPREQTRTDAGRLFAASRWRIAIPYAGIPIVAVVFLTRLRSDSWQWSTETRVLVCLGFALVVLVLARQYVTLMRNRRLNAALAQTSSQLQEKLGDLADLNRRLEMLNSRSNRLNSLREVRAVAEAGLELACSFARSPGGWMVLRDAEGWESVMARRGPVALHRPGDAKYNAVEVARGVLAAVPLRARGEELGTLWLVRPDETDGEPDMLAVIATQIGTAIDNTRQYEEALHLAERDPITGLFNHRGIHKRLAGESLRAQQNGTELSLVMMDMDDFKLLNDTYGHPVGDQVLRYVSDAIRGVLRHADLAGRVGGDELLVVLPNTGAGGALQLSERLRERLSGSPYVTDSGETVPVNLSFGVASFPADAQSLGQLIETADANLYASKQQGGNTIIGSPGPTETRSEVEGILGVAGKLLDVVGARDHYTRRHSEAVTLYALSLGEALGLPEESLNTLHIAAMLHDVGKIGVSADLLRRPTALNAGEHDLVRRHVDLGAAVISDMPRLAKVAEAVNSHHEHHDGGGYPGEMSGDDIPLLGRILAVADAYSAMILDRPYRKGIGRDQARSELLKAAGTQLDPDLVREFVRLIDTRQAESARARAEAG